MEKIREVDIDENGVFKYILVELRHQKTGSVKNAVRGYEWAEYHADILDRITPRMSELSVTINCLGGGRIRHDSKNKTIFVYGYSVGFGQADHKITQEILRRNYPHYPADNITFSNSGY